MRIGEDTLAVLKVFREYIVLGVSLSDTADIHAARIGVFFVVGVAARMGVADFVAVRYRGRFRSELMTVDC